MRERITNQDQEGQVHLIAQTLSDESIGYAVRVYNGDDQATTFECADKGNAEFLYKTIVEYATIC